MALSATVHQFHVTLSDVQRGVYEELELRVAQHPSETLRFMLERTLAYCLSYEEGITFSKGGVSSVDEPALSVFDATGVRTHWIEIGSPSADRLHKAAKATARVSLYTHVDLATLRKEAQRRPIHRVERIEVHRFDLPFLDALERTVERKMKLELVRTDGELYVTRGGESITGALVRDSLV